MDYNSIKPILMRKISHRFLFQLLLIASFSFVVFDLSAQKEEDPPRDEDIVRSYDTQRYFKERRWNSGSGSDMPMRDDIEIVIREIEAKIKEREQEIKVVPVTIGLVFHMMNTKNPEQAQRAIKTQIEALNRDFNNKSLIEKHPNDPEGKYLKLAASTQITFTIADKEVAQYGSGVATFQDSEKPWASWDQMKDPKYGGAQSIEPSRYLNIWVCDLPGDMGSYASSMYCIDKEDGIVIDGKYFGTTEEGNYKDGKTLTHLIGNYLGLHELWSESKRCADDYVDDTPIANARNDGAYDHEHISTCPGYPAEMVMNFMDSSPDGLLTMFTAGQVSRMHATLELVRRDLLSNAASTPIR
jgi:hypothetical protein